MKSDINYWDSECVNWEVYLYGFGISGFGSRYGFFGGFIL